MNPSMFLLLLLMVVPGCNAQNSSEKQAASSEWWISPKDSPISFRLSHGGRYLDLFNVSHEVITTHTLGCVVEMNGSLHLEKILAERKQELKPGEGLFELKQSYKMRYYDNCKNRASKLAVVKVQFADGKEWTLIAPKSSRQNKTGMRGVRSGRAVAHL
jgi:hypothetical protein